MTQPFNDWPRIPEAIRDRSSESQSLPLVVDERLREKEFGTLDRLTGLGIEQLPPEQADIRKARGQILSRFRFDQECGTDRISGARNTRSIPSLLRDLAKSR